MAVKKEIVKKETGSPVAVYTPKYLHDHAKVGMSSVDPADIRPPQIILAQKSSTLDDFQTTDGVPVKIGQFYHTGKLEALNEFLCVFLWAGKSRYTDRRREGQPERDQYKAIGVTLDDLSPFGMTFRSSSLYALSSLFSAVAGQKRPMYSIAVKMEIKELSNQEGTWWVPVVRVQEPIQDEKMLAELEKMAQMFDLKSEQIIADDVLAEEAEKILG